MIIEIIVKKQENKWNCFIPNSQFPEIEREDKEYSIKLMKMVVLDAMLTNGQVPNSIIFSIAEAESPVQEEPKEDVPA